MRYAIGCALLVGFTLHAQTSSSSQVAQGKQVFEATCAVGYCHGVDGRAGHGPRLRDRPWSRDYLYRTIEHGIPGSSMPAWGGKLPEDKIAAVISYILTISKQDSDAGNKLAPMTIRQPSATLELPGKALFFDPMRDRNCGVCHRVADAGSEIAPKFPNFSSAPADTLLNLIRSQPVSENNIQLTLKDGEKFCGVRAGEDHGSIKIFDVEGTGPPVLRTVDRRWILGGRPCASLNVHGANSSVYSPRELLSIVEFLR